MYKLPYYAETDKKVIADFIAQYPFAFLTGCTAENKPVATQIPVFLVEKDGKQFLSGHMMKNTDHHKAFVENKNVLTVFSGKHTYVSGSWYIDPHTASTWNYMSVHIAGSIRFVDDAELEAIMRKTTLHFEGNNPDSPTVFDHLPNDFKQRALQMIAGFEIEVQKMDAVFKLSQDRDEVSYQNIIDKLKQQDADGQVIAGEMEQRQEALFEE